MVRLDEIGVAGEAVEGGWLVLAEPGDKLVFEDLDVGECLPGQFAPQVLPHPLGRIELGTARRLEQQPDILRDA